jgi:hypothetical protein
MALPRRGRDFSNINNMAKKKGAKRKKKPPVEKSNDDFTSLVDYEKELAAKRTEQLLKGDAEEPHDVVFQSTQAFENGVIALGKIKLQHQSLDIDSNQQLPVLAGRSSEAAKAERIALYTKNSVNGRFGNALKIELGKTKKSLVKNKKIDSDSNILEKQREQSIEHKKKAVKEKNQRRTEQVKLIEEQEVAIPLDKQTSNEVESKTPAPREEKTEKISESKQESLNHQESRLLKPKQDLPNKKQEIDTNESTSEAPVQPRIQQLDPPRTHTATNNSGRLRRLLKRIWRMFLPAKRPVQSDPPAEKESIVIHPATQPLPLNKPSLQKQASDSIDVEGVVQISAQIESQDEMEAATNTGLALQDDGDVPEETDPLHRLRQQQPVFLGHLRNQLRTSKNPAKQMVQILIESDLELTADSARTLIEYVATPWALMSEINYQERVEFLRNMVLSKPADSLDSNTETIERAMQSLSENIDRELLDLLIEILNSRATLSKAELVEIVDDFALSYPKQHVPVVISHVLGRTQIITTNWYAHSSVGEYESICENNMHYMKEKFSQKQIEWANDIFSAFAVENPAKIKTGYSLRKHKYSREFELKVERWVRTHLPDQKFITEDNLKEFNKQQFGVHRLRPQNKLPHIRNTPDILFADPVRIQGHDSKILWIDAKLAMFDPAFTREESMERLLKQMQRYVKAYGPGLMVWGKPFSQEWNERTQPAITHTTMEKFD